MTNSSPIAALLTPRGRGAVATIAFRGDVALIDTAGLFRAANRKPLAEQAIDRIAFGDWGNDPAEEVVVCRVAVDRLEIHCHGGDAAAERVLSQLESAGTTRLDSREFLERIEGTFAADMAEALAAATTPRTAALIARQKDGPLRDAMKRLEIADLSLHRSDVLDLLVRMSHWSAFGLHLTRPWQVVLYGPPNVGKSSLINAMVGFERAIVFNQPGTTRDVVTAETALAGWPVRLSDTAGMREAPAELEAAGIGRAKSVLAEADLRVLVLDQSQPRNALLESELIRFQPQILVLNKSDLPGARSNESPGPPETVRVSAKTGDGLPKLSSLITSRLVPVVPAEDEPIPVTRRQVEAIEAARTAARLGDVAAFRTAVTAVAP